MFLKLKTSIRVVRILKYSFTYFQWLFKRKNPNSSLDNRYVVNMLVVGNVAYASLASICIKSFSFYHPQTSFLIYGDKPNIHALRRKIWLWKRLHNRIHVTFSQIEDNEPWQEHKLKIIEAMMGSDEIFMDADLMWHGSLPNISRPYFFVKEFALDENVEYRSLVKKLEERNVTNCFMKNTSVFSWNNLQSSDYLHKRSEVQRIIDDFIHFTSNENLKGRLNRIREQLFLSVAFDYIGVDVDYLKSWDIQGDGQFVESSYFGASGSRFMPWGLSTRSFRLF